MKKQLLMVGLLSILIGHSAIAMEANRIDLTQTNLDLGKLPHNPRFEGDLSTVFQQSHVETLYLDNRGLEHLPPTIGNLSKLTKLVLSNNKLTTIPHTISNLTRLQILTLSNNSLEDNSFPIAAFIALQSLQELDLRGNNFTSAKQQEIKDALPGVNVQF